MTELGNFFSDMSKDNQEKIQKSMNKTQGDRKDVLPGKYVMEITAFAWKDKKNNDEKKQVPDFMVTKRNALQLKMVLRVADEGTEVVPEGSTIFHNVTIAPAQGSDPSKIDTIMRFTKPILTALTGESKIDFTEKWLYEYCCVDFEEDANGSFQLKKDHKMKNRVYVTVDEQTLDSGQIMPSVKFINSVKPGDKSMTNSREENAGLTLDNKDQKGSENTAFNFGLNDASKDPVPASGAPSTIDGLSKSSTDIKEEDS